MSSICRTIRRTAARKNGQPWKGPGIFVEDYPVAMTTRISRRGKVIWLPCKWRTRSLHPTKGWRSTAWATEANQKRFAMVCRVNGVREKDAP